MQDENIKLKETINKIKKEQDTTFYGQIVSEPDDQLKYKKLKQK